MRARTVAAGLACVALIGCGTTAKFPTGTPADQASGLAAAPTAPSTTAAPNATGPGAPVTAGPGAPLPAGAAPSGPTSSAQAASAGVTSTGVSGAIGKGTIELGIDTYSNQDAALSIGLKAVPTLGGAQIYQALVDYLNKHGGLAGRQIVPVVFQEPIGGTTDQQQVCADFTEDHHVFAVLSDRSHLDGTLLACLGPRNTPLINDFEGYYDETMLQSASAGFYLPDMISGQRLVQDWIPALQRLGYFSPKAKIGLLTVDDPIYAKAAALVPGALAAIGYKLAATESIGVANTAAATSEIAGAVLQFKAAGIDHVLVMDEAPELSYLFPVAALTQGYFPRYGFNSFNTPAFVSENGSQQELHGALGIGWLPQIDIPDNPPVTSSADAQCRTMFRAESIDLSSPNNASVALQACALVLFLQAALERAPALTPAGLRAGVEALGTSFQSPFTFGTDFGPGHYDGAAEYRGFAYGDACKCFTYTTPNEPF